MLSLSFLKTQSDSTRGPPPPTPSACPIPAPIPAPHPTTRKINPIIDDEASGQGNGKVIEQFNSFFFEREYPLFPTIQTT